MGHRLTLKSIIICLFIAAAPLTAQPGTVPDEPITIGRWNEYHPAVSRSVSYGPNEWLVFERQTDDSSFIVAKKFRRQSPTWDSSEVIISRSSSAEGQCNPDIAWSEAYGLIAWQKKTAGTWNIFASTYSKFTQVWSAPAAVTRETADCMNVRVGFLHVDSQFVAVWQSGRAVRMRKLPNDQSGTGDTIALSNLDAIRFDLGVDPYHPRGAVLYGITTGGRAPVVSKAFTYRPAFALEAGDTIRSAHSILNPRYLQSFWGHGGFFLYVPLRSRRGTKSISESMCRIGRGTAFRGRMRKENRQQGLLLGVSVT